MSGGAVDPGRPWAGLDALVDTLAPRTDGIEAFLDATRGGAPVAAAPFAPERLDALRDLSESLLQHPLLKRDPASVAVGFWMRPASVTALRAEFERRWSGDTTLVVVPQGRVLHLAPANVDTMFLYSWALSFLCGNADVVRLSQDRGTVVEALLAVIAEVAERHAVLASGARFVTYAHDERVTAALSAWCAHRTIWGGTDTVEALRPVPLNPNASERVFGTKFSYAVISASAYLAADQAARAKLHQAFFNDVFWFDQMACSSPHLVYWVGDDTAMASAVGSFETALQAEVERRHLLTPASSAVHRRSFAFDLAARAHVRVDQSHAGFTSVTLHDVAGREHVPCGGGLVRHARLDELTRLADEAGEGDQTVTHFGFSADELRALAPRLGACGVDRLVPVGQALAFDVVWDGFDLLADFTRRVRVRPA